MTGPLAKPPCPTTSSLHIVSTHPLSFGLQAKAQAGGEFNVFKNITLAQRPAVLSFAQAEGADCDGLPVAELKQLHRARAAGIWKVSSAMFELFLWASLLCGQAPTVLSSALAKDAASNILLVAELKQPHGA